MDLNTLSHTFCSTRCKGQLTQESNGSPAAQAVCPVKAVLLALKVSSDWPNSSRGIASDLMISEEALQADFT